MHIHLSHWIRRKKKSFDIDIPLLPSCISNHCHPSLPYHDVPRPIAPNFTSTYRYPSYCTVYYLHTLILPLPQSTIPSLDYPLPCITSTSIILPTTIYLLDFTALCPYLRYLPYSTVLNPMHPYTGII